MAVLGAIEFESNRIERTNDVQARLVIVTGARPQVSTLLQQAGIKEEFRDDLRVTSKEALKVTLLLHALRSFALHNLEAAASGGGSRVTRCCLHSAVAAQKRNEARARDIVSSQPPRPSIRLSPVC